MLQTTFDLCLNSVRMCMDVRITLERLCVQLNMADTCQQGIFGMGDFLLTILKYQKPMIAWSKTGNHMGGSLPSFMRKFGMGDFLSAFDLFEISKANDILE